MSLSQVIRRYLLVSLIIILVVGSISSHFIVKNFIHYSTDQDLYEHKEKIENYVNLNDTFTVFTSSVFHPQRLTEKVIKPGEKYHEGLKDTLLYNELTGGFQPYRQLYFTVQYKNRLHLITLNEPTVVFDDLLFVVIGLLVLIVFLLIILIYAIDFYLRRRAWAPLDKTLNKLRSYHLAIGETLVLEHTGIAEFEELNEVINKMINKINSDYENVKNFSEDTSHEMQTPLAVIKSKLELLKQNKSLDKDSLNSVMAISRSISRLSKMNQSLLLLTKIQNNQYQDTERINLSQTINEHLEEINELIEAKEINKEFFISKDIMISMNSNLLDILLSNLLSNAIKHNISSGNMAVKLDGYKFTITNTCQGKMDDDINLFERMRNNKTKDSIGLGLNIVKSIIDQYKYSISYSYPEKNTFSISIHFLSKDKD